MPANSDSSFWSDLGYSARSPFRTETDYRSWLNQLHEIPAFFDEQIANMRAGEARMVDAAARPADTFMRKAKVMRSTASDSRIRVTNSATALNHRRRRGHNTASRAVPASCIRNAARHRRTWSRH